MGKLEGSFALPNNVFTGGESLGTIRSISFKVRRKAACDLIKRDKYNGSAANQLVSELLAPDRNRV